MQKIIINATNIGKNLFGIGRYSLSLCRYFLAYWNHPFEIYINRHALVHFEKIKNKKGIKIVKGYISPDFGFKGHLPRLLWTNKLCFQNQKRVVFNTSQLEGCIYHKKQIITVHDLIPLLFPQHHKKQYHYFKYILPSILKKSIKILTVSQHTKNLITDLYKIPEEKISVIYNGIDEHFLNCESHLIRQNYILYVGRISPTKNIEGLIKAFEILMNRYKIGLKLKLVGGGFHELKFNINNKIKGEIELLDNVCDEELRRLYTEAVLFVFPSFYEGFGLPPLEAMASGCPVVCSNAASLPEVCGNAAYYVNPYNVESISEGIYKVLTDERLRQNLIQKGLERVKFFSWEKSAREHIKFFEEVLTS